MVQDIDFTVELKNLSFTHRFSARLHALMLCESGYFLNRCGINSLCQGLS